MTMTQREAVAHDSDLGELLKKRDRRTMVIMACFAVLLALVAVVATTGFLSHAAYMPDLPGNRLIAHALPLTFDWPTSPSWIYAVNQSLHTNVGLVAIPFLLAKLWSVLPKLFSWPPVRSPAHALERLSLVMIVGGALFEFATGILNIQDFYVFPFSFYTAHLYGAWIFVAGLIASLGFIVCFSGVFFAAVYSFMIQAGVRGSRQACVRASSPSE